MQALIAQLKQTVSSLSGRFSKVLRRSSTATTGSEESSLWPLADALRLARNPDTCTTRARCEAYTFAPLEAGDPRFSARDEPMAALEQIIEVWRSGRPTMAIVSGPQGCGVTSLLNQIQRHLSAEETLRSVSLAGRANGSTDMYGVAAKLFDLDPVPDSPEALIRQINSATPRVVIIDNAHYLASRVRGAADTARSLGSLMVASQQRHLWIMGCRRQAWKRMIYLYQADRFFTHSIELDYFNSTQLSALLAARMEAAGEASDDSEPRDLQRLQQLSRGKPDLAFLYQLCGALDDPETARPLDLGILKGLEIDDLFTLAELAVHGTLHQDEHRDIFRIGPASSKLRLEQLCNWGLVERVTADDPEQRTQYRIAPLLSAHITDFLFKSNYLY